MESRTKGESKEEETPLKWPLLCSRVKTPKSSQKLMSVIYHTRKGLEASCSSSYISPYTSLPSECSSVSLLTSFIINGKTKCRVPMSFMSLSSKLFEPEDCGNSNYRWLFRIIAHIVLATGM
jgi:hypothetical protein